MYKISLRADTEICCFNIFRFVLVMGVRVTFQIKLSTPRIIYRYMKTLWHRKCNRVSLCVCVTFLVCVFFLFHADRLHIQNAIQHAPVSGPSFSLMKPVRLWPHIEVECMICNIKVIRNSITHTVVQNINLSKQC